MSRNFVFPLIVAGAGVAVFGCKHSLFSERGSNSLHQEGNPTPSVGFWNWKTEVRAEISASLINQLGLSAGQVLPETHPATLMGQKILNQLDSSLRSAHPGATAKTPTPKIIIVAASNNNAFVRNTVQCVPLELQIGDSAAAKHNKGVNLSNFLDVWSAQAINLACRTPALTEPEIKTFRDQVARNLGCNLTVQGNRLVISTSCAATSNIKAGLYNGIAVPASGNHIVAFSGFFLNNQTEHIISILAHELAHYYRAHGGLSLDANNFFYDASLDVSAGRPQEVKLPATAAIILEKIKAEEERDLAKPKPIGARFGLDEMTVMALSIQGAFVSESLGKRGGADAFKAALAKINECQAFTNSASSNPAVQLMLRDWPMELSNNPEFVKTYLEAGTLAAQCASKLTFEDAGATKEGLLSRSKIRSFYTRSSLQKVFTNSFVSLLDWVTFIEKESFDSLSSLKKLMAELVTQKIGFYTTEQEADDLGLEIMTLAGVNPVLAIDSMFALQNSVVQSGALESSPFETSPDECLKQLKSNPGSFVPILGPLNVLHHTYCYRVYNMIQEIEVRHGHKVSKPWDAVPFSEHASLKAELNQLSVRFGKVEF